VELLERTRLFSGAEEIEFEPNKAFEFLQTGDFSEYFFDSSEKDFPELRGELEWYKNEKGAIFQKLKQYLLSTPDRLTQLDSDRLKFVIEKDLTNENKGSCHGLCKDSFRRTITNFYSREI